MSDDEGTQIQEASRGDAAAVEWLLERHIPNLRAYVRLRMGRLVAQRETPSDLVQSTCREVLQKLRGFEYRGEAAFKKWLFDAALLKIMERQRYHRAAKRDARRDVGQGPDDDSSGQEELRQPYAAVFSPSQAAIGREDVAGLEKAFADLPEEYADVILLSRLIGLSHREIARDLGRTEGSVRVLLHRALARLSVLLSRNQHGQDGSPDRGLP